MFNFKRSSRVLLSAVVVSSAVAALASTQAGASAPVAPRSVKPSVLRAASVSAPSGEDMPVGDLAGWHQIFTDDFSTDVPLGRFPTDVASKWSAYPSPWKDTTGYGSYSPLKVDSVAGGVLNENIHTEGGVAMVSALQPQIPHMTYGRYAVRYKFDSMTGYKTAFMLWPDSNQSIAEGEVDFPEMNLNTSSAWAFMHRTNSQNSDDQSWFNPPMAPGTWHTAIIEWSPNLVVFKLDGAEIGRTSVRTPSTPMHWVLQAETALTLTAPPDPAVQGNIQIDWASVWAYDPTTADITAPVAAITAPTAGSTVGGTVALAANATDNKAVLGVQFAVDGTNLGAEVTAAPYTIPWNTALAANGTHTVTAVARDNAGNTTTATSTVNVDNTFDTTPPTLGTLVPQVNGTIFPADASLNSKFSEAVTGVSATSYTLKNTITGVLVPADVTYTLDTNQSIARLNPINDLTNDTKYTVTMTNAIKDRAGNPLTTTSWNFVTGPAPTATPQTPAPGATNIDRNTMITATASENLTMIGASTITVTPNGGTKVALTASFNTGTNTLTIDPTATLAANTTYTVTLTNNIKDTVGNPLKTTTWTFTTGN